MDLNYIKNCALSAPGLVIKADSSALAKFGNTIRVKANGIISGPKTTADLPSFATSKGIGGVASTVIEAGNSRFYTVLADVSSAGVITLSLVHGEDFTGVDKTKYINLGNFGDSKKAIIGYIRIKNGAATDFTPGTTALDAANVATIYIDQVGFIGV